MQSAKETALPYADADRIVCVAQNDRLRLRGIQHEWFSGPDSFDVLERNVVSESLRRGGCPRPCSRAPMGSRNASAPPACPTRSFSILGVGPALVGYTKATTTGPDPVLVLSQQIRVSRFGADDGVLGKLVAIEGTSYEVIGVMPPGVRPSRRRHTGVDALADQRRE